MVKRILSVFINNIYLETKSRFGKDTELTRNKNINKKKPQSSFPIPFKNIINNNYLYISIFNL